MINTTANSNNQPINNSTNKRPLFLLRAAAACAQTFMLCFTTLSTLRSLPGKLNVVLIPYLLGTACYKWWTEVRPYQQSDNDKQRNNSVEQRRENNYTLNDTAFSIFAILLTVFSPKSNAYIYQSQAALINPLDSELEVGSFLCCLGMFALSQLNLGKHIVPATAAFLLTAAHFFGPTMRYYPQPITKTLNNYGSHFVDSAFMPLDAAIKTAKNIWQKTHTEKISQQEENQALVPLR